MEEQKNLLALLILNDRNPFGKYRPLNNDVVNDKIVPTEKWFVINTGLWLIVAPSVLVAVMAVP